MRGGHLLNQRFYRLFSLLIFPNNFKTSIIGRVAIRPKYTGLLLYFTTQLNYLSCFHPKQVVSGDKQFFLICHYNFKITWFQFLNYVKEENEIIVKVKSTLKYDWAKK